MIKIENIFYISNNHGINMMLCSPFYGFKNNFQKQTNDKGPVDVKSGDPVKILGKKCCMKKSLVSIFSKIIYVTATIDIYIFIAIALNETSILVAVHFSMQNIYQSCDLGHAVGRSNVSVSQ